MALTKSQKETLKFIRNHKAVSSLVGFIHKGSAKSLMARKLVHMPNGIDYELTKKGQEWAASL